MRCLLLGAEGQLGMALQALLKENGIACGRQSVDIASLESISQKLSDVAVDCVINAAAYNQVDRSEAEPAEAYRVNALGPRNLAIACAERELRLIHISTDYVFGMSDSQTPWRETDAPGPVSAYGTSKLAGEYFVRSLCPRHFVVRTCGLYGHAARLGKGKGNFVETMLRLSRNQQELRIVDDQHCTPTSASDLATTLLELATSTAYGLYHVVNSGSTTWARFAEEIFNQSQSPTKVIQISSAEYPTKAQRPAYSLLNCDKLATEIGHAMPSWQDALQRYLAERDERQS